MEWGAQCPCLRAPQLPARAWARSTCLPRGLQLTGTPRGHRTSWGDGPVAEGSRPRTVVRELSPTNPSPSRHARADGLRRRWTGWGRRLLSSTRESWARSPGQGRQPGGVLRPQGQWDRGTEAVGTGRTRRVTEFSGFTPRVGGVRGGAPHPRDAQCVLITKTSFSTVPPPPPAPGRGTGHLGGQGPCDILPQRPGGEGWKERRGSGESPKSQIKTKRGT